MANFTIKHITKYSYDLPVYDSANQIMLYPIKDDYQEVINHKIHISNEPFIDIFKDFYGNLVGSFTQTEAHSELIIESDIEIIVKEKPLPNLLDINIEEQWSKIEDIKATIPYINFLKNEYFDGEEELWKEIDLKNHQTKSPLEIAENYCKYIFDNFKYIKGITNIETTVSEIWKLKSGVCQDFAHMLLVMLRRAGLPARYVSGYICPNKNGMRGEGATHAWVEVYIPNYGWLGLDPTNNCIANEKHVRLAFGRNFLDVSPVKGTYKGTANHKLEVKVIISYEGGIPENSNLIEEIISNNFRGNSYQKFVQQQQQQQ